MWDDEKKGEKQKDKVVKGPETLDKTEEQTTEKYF